MVFHVLNRAVARHAIFQKDGDYEAFERVFAEALETHPIRVLSYCLMPNHWHMVLWPAKDGDLTDFVRWLTHTHTMRWHAHYHSSGTGHLYQGRFKSFPIQADDHLYRGFVTWSGMRCVPTWSHRRRHGDGRAGARGVIAVPEV